MTPPQHGSLLEVDGVRRRFGERTAVDGLSFSVTPGRIVGFLGPNGAGKTTCMRIIVGIDRPDEGEVRWAGEPIAEEHRARFGYLPEQRGLYPKMKVGEQLVYLATLHGLSTAEATSATGFWLERLGIADRADDRLDRLSHGNQQRAQLGAAVVHGPDILVLDEPFSGLDPGGVQAMADVLRERAAAGATVLFSSHQLDLVEHLCEDVVVIDEGRLVLAGRLDALKASAPRRLVVEVAAGAHDWTSGLDVRVIGRDGDRVRLDLDGVDPQAVLDRARAAGAVEHFGIESPSLSELFLKAVG